MPQRRNGNCDLQTSKAPCERQAQGTSLFTSHYGHQPKCVEIKVWFFRNTISMLRIVWLYTRNQFYRE